MDQITVHILPAIKGRNPKIFDPYSNAQFVMGGMEDSCGKGVLEDPQGIRVLPDSEHKLGPGHYLYILVGPGETHGTSLMRSQTSRCPPLTLAACLHAAGVGAREPGATWLRGHMISVCITLMMLRG